MSVEDFWRCPSKILLPTNYPLTITVTTADHAPPEQALVGWSPTGGAMRGWGQALVAGNR
jgi:hypothetical protein